MIGHYEKKTVCLSCKQKVMEDLYEESAHHQLGHQLYVSYFGGYRKVEEKRTPLPVEEKTQNLVWAESEEDLPPEGEEIGI